MTRKVWAIIEIEVEVDDGPENAYDVVRDTLGLDDPVGAPLVRIVSAWNWRM